ncbi:MAG: hypothetical protein ABR889_06285 [Acidobacteriaceae bacterium]|jgi:hypothetical protein
MMVFSCPNLRYARLGVALTAALISLITSTTAHAGPPFQTDDPDPVEFRHFEMYAFELSDGTGKNAGGTALEAPAYEVNYGVVPNVQLHLVLPLAASFAPTGGPTNYGIGDTELGAKVRFVKETKRVPEVGIFPFFELPSGNAAKGLGVGATWYRLPLWIQKSWGPSDRQWTSYGGGGEAIVPAAGYKNYPFSGLLVQRQLSNKLTLGTELFGHGAEGEAATSTRASTLLDLGGIYEFKPGFDLLFAAGRSIHGQPETYTYLSLYWTWGPGGAGDTGGAGDQDQASSATGSKMLSALTRLRMR